MNRLIDSFRNYISRSTSKRSVYDNLVFEGGGVKGIAYSGAIQALEDAGILCNIKRVAGTSAGAITALLLSLGYTAPQITHIFNNTDYTTFEDGWNPFRTTTRYGLYVGDTFLSWIKKLITDKQFDEEVTFKQLDEADCRELHIFATDLNIKDVKCFSVHTTPDVKVAEAIRASMSIPLFFAAWQFTDNNPDNHIYVDGGTVFNYPIIAFDSNGHANRRTLGFNLDNLSGEQQTNDLQFNQPIEYVKNLFNTLLAAQEIKLSKNTIDQQRTIHIDDYGISATDFNLDTSLKQKLYDSGRYYTLEYLKMRGLIKESSHQQAIDDSSITLENKEEAHL